MLLCFCFEKLKNKQQGTINNMKSTSVSNTELANINMVNVSLSI